MSGDGVLGLSPRITFCCHFYIFVPDGSKITVSQVGKEKSQTEIYLVQREAGGTDEMLALSHEPPQDFVLHFSLVAAASVAAVVPVHQRI